jgi:hypothetical protein
MVIFSRIARLSSALLLLIIPLSLSAAEFAALERMNFGYSATGTVATEPLWITHPVAA